MFGDRNSPKEQHMSKFSMLCLSALATSLLAATAGAGAVYGSSDEPPSVNVRYDDLNLASVGGRSTLYRRLKQAAQRVCPNSDASDMLRFAQAQACQVAAVQRALHSIGGPVVAQLQVEHGLLQQRTVSQD
jgi:UrcA family protein